MAAVGTPLLHMLQNGLCHKFRLVHFVHGTVPVDLAALVPLGPQLLFLPGTVVPDHRVCRIQDRTGGTVVLLQPDHLTAGKLLLKIQDIFNGSTPEFVDALVIISHHAQVLMGSGQQAHQPELRLVGVLILIHQNILILTAVLFQCIREF